MHLAGGRQRQAINDDWMDGTVAQQVEQRCHVRFELLRVRPASRRDHVEDCAATAEKQATQRAP